MKTLREATRPTFFFKPQKLNDLLGLDVTIATETFQFTGSFKFRAAYNLALSVPNERILTASSGNFGQALAYACKILGKRCVVVMPANSARVKIDAVRGYGATVDLVDTASKGRNERVAELAAEMPDAYRASAYDDPFVIEGNSTLGDEIADFGDFDTVVAPVGGGGLISGISAGLCRQGATAELLGAEPLLGNDAARSLREGRIVANEKEPATVADGARTISLGVHNWEIIKDGVKEIVEVSEERIREALRLHFSHANLKTEPTGALSLGALLASPERFRGRSVCIVVSGGNVDAAIYREILAG
jgi:threonine dehydratase